MRSETLCQQVACSHPMVQTDMKDAFAHVGISHVYRSAPRPPRTPFWGGNIVRRPSGLLACPESCSLFTTSAVPVRVNIQLITASCDRQASFSAAHLSWWPGQAKGSMGNDHISNRFARQRFCCVLNMNAVCCRHAVAAGSAAIKLNNGVKEVQS